MKENEYIVFAAMKQKETTEPISVENRNFRVGLNHGDIMNANMYSNIKVGFNESDYGFLTNLGRFVDRREAAEIARRNDQLKASYKETVRLNSFEIELSDAIHRFKEENYKLYVKIICIDND